MNPCIYVRSAYWPMRWWQFCPYFSSPDPSVVTSSTFSNEGTTLF